MKRFFCIIFILFVITKNAFCENAIVDTTYIRCHLVDSGYLINVFYQGSPMYDSYHCIPLAGIGINSSSPSVFSISGGTVETVVTIDSGVVVMAIRNGKRHYVYIGLGELLVKQGDVVKKDDKVGLIHPDGSRPYTFYFQAWNKKRFKHRTRVSHDEMMELLQADKISHRW